MRCFFLSSEKTRSAEEQEASQFRAPLSETIKIALTD